MTDCLDWSAWYNRMPGTDDDQLHVAGKCEVSSSSTEIRLEPYNEGPTDDPELIVLRLVVDEASMGDTMMSTKDVTYESDESNVKRVTIRIPDGEDAQIEVQEAS